MRKNIGWLALILTMMIHALNATAGVREGGGGAACVDANGNLSTLYYCGAYHEQPAPTPSTPPAALSIDGPSEQPVDLTPLINYINSFPYLSDAQKTTITNAMKPSFTRKYFSALTPPDLTAPVVSRIKAEFQRATGIDPSKLTLYAVTDTNAHMDNYSNPITVTYLLPAFFALPTQEQRMVALFHENLWALQPSADYPTIIGQETAFEAVMAQPSDTVRLLDFVTKMEGDAVTRGSMTLTLRQDIESGALKGFVDSDGDFTNLQLLGKDVISCLAQVPTTNTTPQLTVCATEGEDYLDNLRRTYPRSNFLALLDTELKKLFDWSLSSAQNYTDDIGRLDCPSGVLYELIRFANGDPDTQELTAWNTFQPKLADWSPYGSGTAHLFWSLAAKDSSGNPIQGSGAFLGLFGLNLILTTDSVLIHVDTSAQGAVNGPLVTATVPFPNDAAGGANLLSYDAKGGTLSIMSDGDIQITDLFGQATLDCIVTQSQASNDPTERSNLLLQQCYPLLKTQLQYLAILNPRSQIIRFLQSELTPSLDNRAFGIVEVTLKSCSSSFLHMGCNTTKTGRIDNWVRGVKGGLNGFKDMLLAGKNGAFNLYDNGDANENSRADNPFNIPLYLDSSSGAASAAK